MKIKVAINGFGRIGRLTLRRVLEEDDFEVVAINDLASPSNLAYLLKYDSAHGVLKNHKIDYDDNHLIVDDKKIAIYSIKDPASIPFDKHKSELVLECSGVFRDKKSASKHLKGSVKGVIISAPAKGGVPTFVYGVNDNDLKKEDKVISGASCTTNCLAPIVKVFEEAYGINGGFMTTVHAYTNDQSTLDLVKEKDFRRGRASASNIIPTSTGAAKALGLVIPKLKGKIDGKAIRIPVVDGSLVDLTLSLKKDVSIEEINNLVKEKSEKQLKGVLGYSSDMIVSTDIIGDTHGALFDSTQTNVLKSEKEQFVSVVGWYDNEYGYCAQLLRLAKKMHEKVK